MPDGSYWVVVRCEFCCRSCGFYVPLNYLDIDGSVDCMRCGVNQVFDVDSWRLGLSGAHEAGDLGGLSPEGRLANPHVSIADNNPLREIGNHATSAVSEQKTSDDGISRSLRVVAAPGFPLCDVCNTPLSARVSGTSVCMTCPGCGDSAEYETPIEGPRLYHNLLAVVAPEHRIDATDCTEDHSARGGALAVRCPNCAGALAVDGEHYFINCEFCHTPVRIREETMRKLVKEPKPYPWWLLYRGPSEKRFELERSTANKEGKSRGSVEVAPLVQRSLRNKLLEIGIPLLTLLLVGSLGFADNVREWQHNYHEGRSVAASGATKPGDPALDGSDSKSTPSISMSSDSVKLRKCSCRRKKGNPLLLELSVVAEAGQFSLTPSISNGQNKVYQLPVDGTTAPPQQILESDLDLGIACTKDGMIIASKRNVSRWSFVDRRLVWSVKLPKDYWPRRSAGGPGVQVWCEALKFRRDRVRIPVKGRSIKLRLKDGSRR